MHILSALPLLSVVLSSLLPRAAAHYHDSALDEGIYVRDAEAEAEADFDEALYVREAEAEADAEAEASLDDEAYYGTFAQMAKRDADPEDVARLERRIRVKVGNTHHKTVSGSPLCQKCNPKQVCNWAGKGPVKVPGMGKGDKYKCPDCHQWC